MEISIYPHSIIIFVGEKSEDMQTFLEKKLIPQLQFENMERGFKLKTEMLVNDKEPFNLSELEGKLLFPNTPEFVIIKEPCNDETIRKQILDIAKRNAYRVVPIFFKSKKEESNRIIRKSEQVMLKSLSQEHYPVIYHYNPNRENNICIQELETYKNTHLPINEEHIYLTDVHECLEELQEVIRSYGCEIKQGRITFPKNTHNKKFVLMGDYIDKGGETKATIEFLYDNQDHFYFIVGNHENFVYKLFKGMIDGTQVKKETQEKYFTSIPCIKKDEQLHKKFNILFEQALPFTKSIGRKNGQIIYASHAPCKNKYLGKIHPYSRARQRNFRIDRSEDIQSQLEFIQLEANEHHPYHLFGHVMSKNFIHQKNKLGLDTGCVAGNKLTTVIFDEGKPKFLQVKAREKRGEVELPALFENKEW